MGRATVPMDVVSNSIRAPGSSGQEDAARRASSMNGSHGRRVHERELRVDRCRGPGGARGRRHPRGPGAMPGKGAAAAVSSAGADRHRQDRWRIGQG
jgi:hypothetical protein